MLVGIALIVGGSLALWKVAGDPLLDAAVRIKLALGGVAMLPVGGWWVHRSWRVGRRYWAILSRAECT